MKRKAAGVGLLALLLGAIGWAAMAANEAWLVPSLGSAAFLQCLSPAQPTARAWNTLVGQLVGAVCGTGAVLATGAAHLPAFTGHHLDGPRVLAAAIAVLATAAGQLGLRALSPAGGATALLVAIGTDTADAAGFGRLAVGIVLVTIGGEACRRLLLRFPE